MARIGVTGAPPWSQAWGWGMQVSAWWPGLCPQDPAGRSPNEQRGPVLPWAHHSREGSEGAGAVGYGWQSWAGALTARSLDGNSSHGDMECHLAGGERV